MYSCTMPVQDPGGPGGKLPPQEAVSVLKKFAHFMYGNGLVEVWGGLLCFNGPHDGYANRSNSQTGLPRAIGSPTDSRTVLLRALG